MRQNIKDDKERKNRYVYIIPPILRKKTIRLLFARRSKENVSHILTYKLDNVEWKWKDSLES